MDNLPNRADLQAASGFLRQNVSLVPDVAVVLGSGLGGFAEYVEVETAIPYSDIPGFPRSTVEGHAGRFLFGHLGDVPIVLMQGRVHYYEGYSMQQVVSPIRLMGIMGAQKLILTNAAGGMNPDFNIGDMMMITDHIAMFVPNPLIGPNDEFLGKRFPDMGRVYDPILQQMVRKAAENVEISLREGVYVQLTGPSLETPAEVRFLQKLGGDAVGMSTACEAIAAHHMGMKVAGISCITNYAAGMSKSRIPSGPARGEKARLDEDAGELTGRFLSGQFVGDEDTLIVPDILTHEEVQAAAQAAGDRFGRLLAESVELCWRVD